MPAEPYYTDEFCTIYHADCRDVLPTLDRSELLAVTDPPYNIGYGYESYHDRLEGREYRDLLMSIGRPSVISHYPEALVEFGVRPKKCVAWVYYAHVGPSWRMVAWYGVAPRFELLPEEYRNPSDKRVSWLRAEGQTSVLGDEEKERSEGRPLRDWWHIEQVKNVSKEPKHRSDGEIQHPCPLPPGVVHRILSVTPEPTTVIDPFMGSGTTLRVAKDLGRKAIGVELSERYCEMAARLLQQEVLTA